MDAALSEETCAQDEQRDLVRFITCGSVDDGKSTLIGRLLHESSFILDDQLAALVKDSARHGTTGEEIDFALLVDGLEAEREQGITIDVAYRFFATSKRSFIVADTPGHEQYTRNMATGASNAQLAVILVDARKGVLAQTRRHSFICSLFGIRHVVVAVNKMDLVNFDREAFERIVADYKTFASHLGFLSIVGVPISERSVLAWLPRSRRYLDDPAALSLCGSVGQSAKPRFSRLCRYGRVGHHCSWRRGCCGYFRPYFAG
jgi:bifunctional enzyme CysN/CysC